jgi:hypothetical protein
MKKILQQLLFAGPLRLKAGILLFLICWASLQTARARSIGAPSMIYERSLGADLARQVEEVMVKHSASPKVADTMIKNLLSRGMSSGGLYYERSFPKGIFYDATRSDVMKVITNLMRSNRKNWSGYMRELKFINELASSNSPFVLERAGGRELIKDGRLVEFDLLVRDKRSNLKMAIEVKEWKIRSQADLNKSKGQIQKIAMRAREEGVERVVWVNRERVPERFRTELEKFARSQNVGFYDDISTSQRLPRDLNKPGRLDDVLEKESRSLGRTRWGRAAGKTLIVLGVVWETYQAGAAVQKWRNGRMTNRELVSEAGGTAGGMAGGVAGGYAGAQAGAYIGTFFGPGYGTAVGAFAGGLIGAVGGGVAGTFAGTEVANTASEKMIFRKLNDYEKQKIINGLLTHYQQVGAQ